MPARKKSFQICFVESLLVISLAALVGHLSLNFWGRYREQTELLKMKTSLYTLKDTINQIGMAYNELHKELQELADVTETGNLLDNKLPENYGEAKKQHSKILAKKFLQDIQLHTMLDNGILTKIPQTASNKLTQTALNETTSYNPTALLERNKKDKNVGDKGFHNKKVQYNMHLTVQGKDTKNAGIATRNSLKSIAANTEIDESQNRISSHKYDRNNRRENIHKCHNNMNDCSTNDNGPHLYSRF